MHTRVQVILLLKSCIMLCFTFPCIVFQSHALLGLAVTVTMVGLDLWFCVAKNHSD